ncbi:MULTISPECIES: ABC transporter ATP-binding protein [Methylobacterium]|uniref:ABC transporter ATP-binding protein NatA n=1 Tax=Methylobacterium bullatum TaxID=570505 RepID=A0A679KHN3_9HYPH|nr:MULTISPECIES: ABC transporter ATP-binding protein [Methylobacterium]KQP37697.1 ABC transporter ATP-binding protein [Methylobacterium sp. Leaf106]MBD8900758.1 ABC transporter ATP-binding protein [Methylobacterium bullatum]TXN31751.1 ATP-binding cassette domain-containing protein [Methylobacterium sp. WL19]CAA2144626.1 ABC transporter ATP-binding protein NatA [Methylobacterium bullatum]GJD39621.1 Linearmycin resistance ATP-binding protein LnrL [Methylobacterium bullatum]
MSDGAGESAALDVAGVSHRFGARAALSDVSIRVERGRFMALLGPNGAGKTTLFSVITRLYASQDGRVSIFGHGLDREPSRALARLGVVFQARTLDTDLTVEQNLLYHASLHGIARRAAKARIAALLARVGLSDRRDDKVRTLSGGQSRRIEIARSLVHEPKLLLLDEPTVGLDLESRADIVAIVRALVREEGLSVLWATHIFEEIDGADDAVVLHKGRIVARGTADSIAQGDETLEAAFRRLVAEPPRQAA